MEQIIPTLFFFFPYFTLFFIILLSLYFTLYHLTNTKKQPHGFQNYPILGTLPQFLANRHRFLEWSFEILSPLPTHTSVLFRPGNVQDVFTAYPPNVEHFLKTHFDNYPKGARFISLLHDFLGTGIFNSDDHLWRHQRKTASFEFNKRSLKNFVLDSIRLEITTRLIPIFKDASGSDRVLDLQNILERFSFDNVCKLAFDFDPGCLTGDGSGESAFMGAFDDAAMISAARFLYTLPFFIRVKKFFNVGSEKRLSESIKTVYGFADMIIRTRLEEISRENISNDNSGDVNSQDLLSRFIFAGEKQDCNFLRDVVINFILAGKDSTSSVLSWFFWLLSKNLDVLTKVRSEVGEVRNRAGKKVGDMYDFNDLREMNYLHAALSETLRLYPPVPFNSRLCLEDDMFPDGTKIKKGWIVTYCTYIMGRMESIWGKDCLMFRPERWIDENGSYKPENLYKYPVFHAGPRICLGKEMAYLQMKSIVACVVEQFDVVMVQKEKSPEYVMSLTLRMKNGLPVRLKARQF